MARIDIQGGLERDEFYDKNGNKLGIAEYDLNDSSVRLKVLELIDNLELGWKDLMDKIESITGDTLSDTIAKTRLEVEFTEKLKADTDNIFGADFCANAIGANCNNILTLFEVIIGIGTKYGAEPNVQMDRLVKSTKNREQKRHPGKK